jgi:hypothetical protein
MIAMRPNVVNQLLSLGRATNVAIDSLDIIRVMDAKDIQDSNIARMDQFILTHLH